MRAKSEYPARHGDQHLADGSDPIPGISDLTEVSAIHGQIIRDGGAGTLAVTSGFLSATTTLIDHNVIDVEDGVDCDIVSVPSRIVIETAGLYLLLGSFTDLDSGSSDYGLCLGFGFNTTGAIWSPFTTARRITSNGNAYLEAVYAVNLDVGDYVTQVVGQNSGSTKTFTYLAYLNVSRVPGRISTVDDLGTIDGGSP